MPNPSKSSPAADLDGRLLRDYQIVRRLGQGAMAYVYLAQQLSLQRFVALKILRAELAGDAKCVQRFQREAQAAAALVHPNIVQIFEIGECDGLHFIAQEYVAGWNVKQWMARHAAFPGQDAVAILQQVASALQQAEHAGIVHRDIKPENILMDSHGVVKVADFGLARVSSHRDQLELTQIGMTLGTPLYMSPEQIQGQGLDSRSDIYSLGVTAFHMLAGRPPFDADNAISIAVQQLHHEPPVLAELRPDLPSELSLLVDQMMKKSPAERPSDAQELQQRLARIVMKPFSNGPLSSQRLKMDSGRLAATRRLAQILQGKSATETAAVPRATMLRTWANRLIPLAAGMAIAWLLAAASPIRDWERQLTSFTREDSVAGQYVRALSLDTERAWKMVIEFVPDGRELTPTETFYLRAAQRNLGRWYLEHRQPTEAIQLYQALADTPPSEREVRAVGLAGLAVSFARQGRIQPAAEASRQLTREQLEPHIEDEYLRSSLVRVRQQLDDSR